MRKAQGITLIALVITIIVLLILAGVSLVLIAGSDGILKKATNAVDRTKESAVLEEIEFAIMDIRAERLNQVTLEFLAAGALSEKLDGITATLGNNEITGEYKGYDYKIDEKFKVTIEVIKGIKFSYELTPKGYTKGNIQLTIKASSSNGKVTDIKVPEDFIQNEDGSYTITKNGDYEITVTDDAGESKTQSLRNSSN